MSAPAITKAFATAFGREWVEAWNAHDLEKILSHYADDFTIESPMALKLYPQSQGIVRGKNDVRNYWAIGLEKSPGLHFDLLEVLLGVNCLGLHLFNTASKRKSIELMRFNGDMKVYTAFVIFSE